MKDEREPDEVLTVVQCPGCQQPSFPKECIDNRQTPTTQLVCPRCGTGVSADNVFDYVDIREVTYE